MCKRKETKWFEPTLEALRDSIRAMEDALEAEGVFPFAYHPPYEASMVKPLDDLTERLLRLARTPGAGPALEAMDFWSVAFNVLKTLNHLKALRPERGPVLTPKPKLPEQLLLFDLSKIEKRDSTPSPPSVTTAA